MVLGGFPELFPAGVPVAFPRIGAIAAGSTQLSSQLYPAKFAQKRQRACQRRERERERVQAHRSLPLAPSHSVTSAPLSAPSRDCSLLPSFQVSLISFGRFRRHRLWRLVVQQCSAGLIMLVQQLSALGLKTTASRYPQAIHIVRVHDLASGQRQTARSRLESRGDATFQRRTSCRTNCRTLTAPRVNAKMLINANLPQLLPLNQLDQLAESSQSLLEAPDENCKKLGFLHTSAALQLYIERSASTAFPRFLPSGRSLLGRCCMTNTKVVAASRNESHLPQAAPTVSTPDPSIGQESARAVCSIALKRNAALGGQKNTTPPSNFSSVFRNRLEG